MTKTTNPANNTGMQNYQIIESWHERGLHKYNKNNENS